MSQLIMRAERGLLGVMLAGTNTTPITGNIEADDFGHPIHRAVYQALRDLELLPHTSIEERATAVAGIVAQPDVDSAWLHELAASAPDPVLVPEYAWIVVQAAFDRDVADFAQPYRDTAELATDPETRDALTRVADALDAQAVVFTPAATIDTDITVQTTLDIGYANIDAQIEVELNPEDQIIADLIQHPEQAREVAAWLDPAVFTTEQRKLTFELAVSLGYDGDPFDPVTLAWQLQRARDVARYDNPDHVSAATAETDYAYLTRVRTATVRAGAAIIVGRDLLVAHVHATLTVSGAEAAERSAHPTREHQQQMTVRQDRQNGLEPPLDHAPAADIRPIEL
ncbi:DnaB-like helicase N-terminal domain-containing protein [Krasilnikovia sp. M28-CT-15]|uniref:DnaB-like helicase N-terminal domain-containing protein n=1 Tax=Krasilnikovia sp. M28-CT-15 TaxID=3373540 RepID=UPI0038772EC5